MNSEQFAVAQFMRLAGQHVPSNATLPAVDVMNLREKLIIEELAELRVARQIGRAHV